MRLGASLPYMQNSVLLPFKLKGIASCRIFGPLVVNHLQGDER